MHYQEYQPRGQDQQAVQTNPRPFQQKGNKINLEITPEREGVLLNQASAQLNERASGGDHTTIFGAYSQPRFNVNQSTTSTVVTPGSKIHMPTP